MTKWSTVRHFEIGHQFCSIVRKDALIYPVFSLPDNFWYGQVVTPAEFFYAFLYVSLRMGAARIIK